MPTKLTFSLQFAKFGDLAAHRAALPRHKVAQWIRHALVGDGEITLRIVGADLVLCAPVVAHEARQQGIALQAHYAHLIVHGTLHAQGWDHDLAEDAQVMEMREADILTGLGFGNPY